MNVRHGFDELLDSDCVLLPPHRSDLDATLLNRVCAALATRFDVSKPSMRKRLQKADVSLWAKVRHLDGGDTMHASTLVPFGDDRRDATYVRVSNFI